MATLPTLVPTGDVQVGTWTTDANGTTNLWQKIEETIASATDTNDFIRAPAGTSNTTANQYEVGFTDTPSDFISMTTLSINVRYNQTGRSDDTLQFLARIESSAGVAYTNDVLVTVTSATFTNTGAMAMGLTTAGTNATKTDWDNAYIALSQIYAASMANDNARVQVSAIELTGTYGPGITVSPTTLNSSILLVQPNVNYGQTTSPSAILAAATLPDATESFINQIDLPTMGVGALGVSSIGLAPSRNVTATPTEILSSFTLNSPSISSGSTKSTTVISASITIPSVSAFVNATANPSVIDSLVSLFAPTVSTSQSVLTSTILSSTTLLSPDVTTGVLGQPQTISASISILSPTLISYITGFWGINAGIVPSTNATLNTSAISSSITLLSTTKTAEETLYATSNIANNGCTTPDNANGAPNSVYTANTGGSTWDARWAIGNPSNALSGLQNGTIHWKKDASGGNDPTGTLELWENGSLVSTLLSAITLGDATFTSAFSFNASAISNRDNIELRVAATASGGSPAARRTIQVDGFAITFNQQV